MINYKITKEILNNMSVEEVEKRFYEMEKEINLLSCCFEATNAEWNVFYDCEYYIDVWIERLHKIYPDIDRETIAIFIKKRKDAPTEISPNGHQGIIDSLVIEGESNNKGFFNKLKSLIKK